MSNKNNNNNKTKSAKHKPKGQAALHHSSQSQQSSQEKHEKHVAKHQRKHEKQHVYELLMHHKRLIQSSDIASMWYHAMQHNWFVEICDDGWPGISISPGDYDDSSQYLLCCD